MHWTYLAVREELKRYVLFILVYQTGRRKYLSSIKEQKSRETREQLKKL